jgi:hypothetical protein
MKDQRPEHLPGAPRLLTALDNPSMGNTPLVKSEVVVIVGDDDATFGTGNGDAECLTRASQAEAVTLHDSTGFHEADQRIGRLLDDVSPHKRIHSA